MSETFGQIIELIQNGEVRVSEHGYDEFANDGLYARSIVERAKLGDVVSTLTYKGPWCFGSSAGCKRLIHVVWEFQREKVSRRRHHYRS